MSCHVPGTRLLGCPGRVYLRLPEAGRHIIPASGHDLDFGKRYITPEIWCDIDVVAMNVGCVYGIDSVTILMHLVHDM